MDQKTITELCAAMSVVGATTLVTLYVKGTSQNNL